VTEAVAERTYWESGAIRHERVGTRTTEVRDIGGLAAEMPAPWWYRTWLRFWEVVVVAAAWLVWAALIVAATVMMTVGAIHLWGPPGVWLAAGATFLLWWCSLVRRAWREQSEATRAAPR
jgi:hypothetical protein